MGKTAAERKRESRKRLKENKEKYEYMLEKDRARKRLKRLQDAYLGKKDTKRKTEAQKRWRDGISEDQKLKYRKKDLENKKKRRKKKKYMKRKKQESCLRTGIERNEESVNIPLPDLTEHNRKRKMKIVQEIKKEKSFRNESCPLDRCREVYLKITDRDNKTSILTK